MNCAKDDMKDVLRNLRNYLRSRQGVLLRTSSPKLLERLCNLSLNNHIVVKCILQQPFDIFGMRKALLKSANIVGAGWFRNGSVGERADEDMDMNFKSSLSIIYVSINGLSCIILKERIYLKILEILWDICLLQVE